MFFMAKMFNLRLLGHKASIMLSSQKYQVDMVDYTPREIKQSIVGNGSASKEQVEFMVKIFKLDDKTLKRNDISDAIAVAVEQIKVRYD